MLPENIYFSPYDNVSVSPDDGELCTMSEITLQHTIWVLIYPQSILQKDSFLQQQQNKL